MSEEQVKEWPKPDLETLDREIGNRLHRVAVGRASSQDVSEASELIRERADFMMPGLIRRHQLKLDAKKAS